MPQLSPDRRVRVLVVDDEALVRSGMALILGAAPDLEVVAACHGIEALDIVRRLRPDVVLLDIRMPGMDGFAVLRRLTALPAPPQVGVLTTFDSDEHLAEAVRGGASGFLLKATPPTELVRAVRALATGAGCLSPAMARRLAAGGRPRAAARSGQLDEVLSPREREVLTFLAQGLSNPEIGARLNIRLTTVKDHVSTVVAKLGVTNRIQAAVLADRAGLLAEAEQL
ncbi:DNA-binding response regulator [Kitasatospora sp. MMS16-BH015]|uniref:response regulator n=1 Tax=Kitasatospora sp. MMS16-BH015 TaxID=2018025 RepID=UPI000CA3C39E|nr:response regulator transcription factor [Kitasatospora sp. MMS16-BH015]AUG81934.1 DNA-binding response regulator [Kitasatospora sp. MMS16-BH015]